MKLWGQPLLSQHFLGQVPVCDLGEDTCSYVSFPH